MRSGSMDYIEELCIGKRIMRLRKTLGYSRRQVAKLAGISEKFLFEIEVQNKGFSIDTLIGIGRALGVSCDYILFGKSIVGDENDILNIIRKFEPCTLQKVGEILEIIYTIKKDN